MSEVNKKIISLEVRGEYILGSGVTIGAQGSFDSVYLRIKFDDKWLGLNKYATWMNALNEVGTQELLTALYLAPGEPDTYDIPVPQFATKYAGTVRLALSGYVIGGEAGREIESLLNSVSGAFKVLESGAVRLDGGKIDATLAERVAEQLNRATVKLDEAEDKLSDIGDKLDEFDRAEAGRNAAEGQRYAAEIGRQEAEIKRFRDEVARDDAENGYENEEGEFINGRVQNEAARVQSENTRIVNESRRERNEVSRIEEEKKRDQKIADLEERINNLDEDLDDIITMQNALIKGGDV